MIEKQTIDTLKSLYNLMAQTRSVRSGIVTRLLSSEAVLNGQIEELKKKVGHDFGVGYSHDSRTIGFLNELAEKNGGRLPVYVRHTWDTAERIMNEHNQLRILSFFKKIIGRKKSTS